MFVRSDAVLFVRCTGAPKGCWLSSDCGLWEIMVRSELFFCYILKWEAVILSCADKGEEDIAPAVLTFPPALPQKYLRTGSHSDKARALSWRRGFPRLLKPAAAIYLPSNVNHHRHPQPNPAARQPNLNHRGNKTSWHVLRVHNSARMPTDVKMPSCSSGGALKDILFTYKVNHLLPKLSAILLLLS